MNLHHEIMKLAQQHPELRKYLVPALRAASDEGNAKLKEFMLQQLDHPVNLHPEGEYGESFIRDNGTDETGRYPTKP
jgi:hypothetical protein